MITVFGSINLDLIGTVARLPRPGETVPGTAFATAPGGKGANQALAARRAGAEVRMVGAVGADGFAAPALSLLEAEGLDLGAVKKAAGPTGVALILVDGKGENVIVVVAGANGTLTERDAAALDFAYSDILLLQLEIPIPAMQVAVRRAREAGARVILNFAPFRPEALTLIESVTHLVVNETECALLAQALGVAGDGVDAQARGVRAKTNGVVVVTLGPEGAFMIDAEATARVPSVAVRAVDTVGAGDTFCGYLAAALSESRALGEALAASCAAAALACTKAGAQPSIPRREEVDALRRTGAS